MQIIIVETRLSSSTCNKMEPIKPSDAFKTTLFIWKIFGLWSDKSSNKYFRLYSCLFTTLTSVSYLFFYTLNLIYTPRTVEIFTTQAVYYFSSLSMFIKIVVVLTKKQEIIHTFETMDCKEFQGNGDKTNEYVIQFKTGYIKYFRAYAAYCSVTGYFYFICVPLLNYYLSHEELKLPVCEYYFLTDESHDKYFFYWYAFQSIGLVSSIINNVTSHTFLCGLISMAITQFKILNWNIANIRLADGDINKNMEEKERVYLNKLYECLKHYETILK